MSSSTDITERPRVLFLNRSYWPDAEATGQLLTELCEDIGPTFDITVISGQPNQNPGGHAYKSFGAEKHRDVEVRRVLHTRFSKNSFLGRITNMVTYLLMSWWTALFLRRPAIVVVETDPPILCILGAFLRWWYGCKFVVYLQDIYPDVAIALGKLPDAAWTRMLRKLFLATYRRADRIVVLSDDMRELLLDGGIEPAKVTRIPNWADTSKIYPVKEDNPFRKAQGLEGKFVVMYSGNMGLSQRLENLLEAAKDLKSREGICFLLVGDGASRAGLEKRAAELGLENVRFLGYQPKETLHESLSSPDLHVVVLDPKISRCLMPSKVYGVMSSGTSVLVAAPEKSELSQMTLRERIGFVVSFDDPKSWTERIRWCAEHPEELAEMGRRAREVAVRDYDRHVATGQFGDMLASISACSVVKA
ncbi:MAG: glycosyltransferase family 4 protein [Planctomycetota bacterium]